MDECNTGRFSEGESVTFVTVECQRKGRETRPVYLLKSKSDIILLLNTFSRVLSRVLVGITKESVL